MLRIPKTILYMSSGNEISVNKDIVATTVDNKWFPAYVSMGDFEMSDKQNNFFEKIVGDAYLYYKPVNVMTKLDHFYRDNTFSDVVYHLTRLNDIKTFRHAMEEYPLQYLTMSRGYLASEQDEILLMLVTDSFSGMRGEFNISYEPKHLKLLVSTELVRNPLYKPLYEYLEQTYIERCYLDGIPVQICSSKYIEENCFGNSFKIKFKSLGDLNETFERLPNLFNKDLAEYFGHFDNAFQGEREVEEATSNEPSLPNPEDLVINDIDYEIGERDVPEIVADQ